MKRRVADYIVQFLHDQYGVTNYFLVTGGGIMHLTDGLTMNAVANVHICHHEQAVSMAVESCSRVSDAFAVGYFTTGPGATNAITGLAGAWLDSVACLFVSGQAKRRDSIYKSGLKNVRQIGVQELNILPVIDSLTKYAAFVDEPEMIRYHLEKAVHMATEGRPGPAWLDVPLDVQGAIIETDSLKSFTPDSKPRDCQPELIGECLTDLCASKRPVILAGQGVRIAGAIDTLDALITRYKIPVVTTYLGVDIIASDHPQYVGRIGVKGDRAGNLAMQNSDLLIIIGTSLPIADTGYEFEAFARSAKKIVIDIDLACHRKRTVPIDTLIEADARDFLSRILDGLSQTGFSPNDDWLKKCISWRDKYPVCLPEYAERETEVNIYYLVNRLSSQLTSEDVVVTDAGSIFYVGSQGVQIKKGMRYITSGGLSTMGYSLPASIGISVGTGNGRVICLTGDGSFQQNIQEVQTVVQYRLPIKIFVLNNGGYLSMRFTQGNYFDKRYIGEGPSSGISFPPLEKIAAAYSIEYVRIEDNRTLDDTLRRILASPDPMLVEVLCPPDQLIMPTVSSKRKEDGTMVSKPLEDMFPFLDRDEFRREMIIEPLVEE